MRAGNSPPGAASETRFDAMRGTSILPIYNSDTMDRRSLWRGSEDRL